MTADRKNSIMSAELADYIKRIVDEDPPLTAAQRDRLAALLRPTAVANPGPKGKGRRT